MNPADATKREYEFDGEYPYLNLPPNTDGFSFVRDLKYVLQPGDLIVFDGKPYQWVCGAAGRTLEQLRKSVLFEDADVWVRHTAVKRAAKPDIEDCELDPDLPARLAAVVHQDQAESVSWFREVGGRRYLVKVTCHGPVTPEDSR